MGTTSGPINTIASNAILLRPCNAPFRPARRVPARKARVAVCSSSLDPWKTLGVSYDADEKQIKKAYRKLALDNHPDLRGSEAAARFVKIQEAYEVVTGKRRGATSESAPRSSSAAAGWDFHDWYWKFTAGKRWDQQRKKPAHSPAAEAARPRPTGAPEEALRAQLAGLRRKAAFRARSRPVTQAQQPGKSWQDPNHSATSASCESSSKETKTACAGHDEFADSQLAGLKRRAKSRQQQQPAASTTPPSTTAPTAESQTQCHAIWAEGAQVQGARASMAGNEQGSERAAAVTEMPTGAAAAVFETAATAEMAVEGESAHQGHLHPLRCARDFMAEVQARSTSSNIVSATFTGLRARLAPTIAQLTHRAAALGPQPLPGTGDVQGRASTMDNGSGWKGDGGSRQSAAREGAHAASGDGYGGQQEAVQVSRQLASQLAGLKRRAVVREYSA
ncbi:probable chaperone protein DnaJ at N-terminal half [Coccomyxa sp. Obi]|nr:probable chaperone protein DnaJ at N-terminal half [Coccomyxa sp. Obi]